MKPTATQTNDNEKMKKYKQSNIILNIHIKNLQQIATGINETTINIICGLN